MRVDIVGFHILHCNKCNRDTLMAHVTLDGKIDKGGVSTLFCSSCGAYMEVDLIAIAVAEQGKQGPMRPSIGG